MMWCVCMGVDVNQIIMWVVIAIGSNLLLWAWAIESGTLTCPNMDTTYETEELAYDVGNQTHSDELGYKDIFDIALGRCDGMPFWVVLLFEIPLIVGGFYILRAFIGAT